LFSREELVRERCWSRVGGRHFAVDFLISLRKLVLFPSSQLDFVIAWAVAVVFTLKADSSKGVLERKGRKEVRACWIWFELAVAIRDCVPGISRTVTTQSGIDGAGASLEISP
jgi:hypothetical protein